MLKNLLTKYTLFIGFGVLIWTPLCINAIHEGDAGGWWMLGIYGVLFLVITGYECLKKLNS